MSKVDFHGHPVEYHASGWMPVFGAEEGRDDLKPELEDPPEVLALRKKLQELAQQIKTEPDFYSETALASNEMPAAGTTPLLGHIATGSAESVVS